MKKLLLLALALMFLLTACTSVKVVDEHGTNLDISNSPSLEELRSIMPQKNKIESTLLDEKPFSNAWIMRCWDYKPHLVKSFKEFQYFAQSVCQATGDENGEYASMIADAKSEYQMSFDLLMEEYEEEFFSNSALVILPIHTGGKLRFDGVTAEGSECIVCFSAISTAGTGLSRCLATTNDSYTVEAV